MRVKTHNLALRAVLALSTLDPCCLYTPLPGETVGNRMSSTYIHIYTKRWGSTQTTDRRSCYQLLLYQLKTGPTGRGAVWRNGPQKVGPGKPRTAGSSAAECLSRRRVGARGSSSLSVPAYLSPSQAQRREHSRSGRGPPQLLSQKQSVNDQLIPLQSGFHPLEPRSSAQLEWKKRRGVALTKAAREMRPTWRGFDRGRA